MQGVCEGVSEPAANLGSGSGLDVNGVGFSGHKERAPLAEAELT
ncbi:MAG: hypothetical protein ACYSYV_06795 [Planctomycetota bacterium]